MYTGKTTQKRHKDGKLKINFDEVTLRAIGHNHGTWARDLGLLARTHLPVRCEVPFNKLSDKVKAPIYEGMLELSKQNAKNRLTNKGYNSSHGSKSYPAHREELVMYTNHKTK